MKYHALQIFVPMQLLQNLHVMLGCRQGEGSGGSVVTLPPMHFFAFFFLHKLVNPPQMHFFYIFLHKLVTPPPMHFFAFFAHRIYGHS